MDERMKYGLILYDINTDRVTYMHPVTHKTVTITDYQDRKRITDNATGCHYIEVRQHD